MWLRDHRHNSNLIVGVRIESRVVSLVLHLKLSVHFVKLSLIVLFLLPLELALSIHSVELRCGILELVLESFNFSGLLLLSRSLKFESVGVLGETSNDFLILERETLVLDCIFLGWIRVDLALLDKDKSLVAFKAAVHMAFRQLVAASTLRVTTFEQTQVFVLLFGRTHWAVVLDRIRFADKGIVVFLVLDFTQLLLVMYGSHLLTDDFVRNSILQYQLVAFLGDISKTCERPRGFQVQYPLQLDGCRNISQHYLRVHVIEKTFRLHHEISFQHFPVLVVNGQLLQSVSQVKNLLGELNIGSQLVNNLVLDVQFLFVQVC